MNLNIENQEFTTIRLFWFIITDKGSDTFYLKKYHPHSNTARWTKNYQSATAFMNHERADMFKKTYLDGRTETCIIEHEIEI